MHKKKEGTKEGSVPNSQKIEVKRTLAVKEKKVTTTIKKA